MFFDWMVLCGTKHGSSMASLEEPFEAPLFLRVLMLLLKYFTHIHVKLLLFLIQGLSHNF